MYKVKYLSEGIPRQNKSRICAIGNILSWRFDWPLRHRRSVCAASTYPWIWRNATLRLREGRIDPRCRQIRFHRKTIKRYPWPAPLPSSPPGKLRIDGVRILFKFPEKSEREGETGCDANLQFQNIPASLRTQKGAPGVDRGGRKGFKSPRVLSSRRNCYFNSTFCH